MLSSVLLRYKAGEIYGAFTKNNELCAVALFATAHNKSIYLVGTSSKSGIKNKAMFLLIDDFIKKNSEHNITLDFEGSRIEGIARFYRGFGAIESKYPSSYPYGCGIIGLEAVKERREEHIKLIQSYKPEVVLIAAGTVDLPRCRSAID